MIYESGQTNRQTDIHTHRLIEILRTVNGSEVNTYCELLNLFL